ncbi:MAG: molybdenum cofactor guanylyltransferase [Candidatus Kapabacteria bacterium]|nr:molybdenum cofactor guanylyltransferase [Candidatus Kapabacteria bacterium]
MKFTNSSAFILAGGKSSRMGTEKSLMKIGDKTVIEIIISRLQPLFESISVISNNPEEYTFLDLPVYEDIFKGQGPISGIHSALTHSRTDSALIISCDIPMISSDAISYIISNRNDKPVTVAFAENYVQELCGVYDKSILLIVENLIKSNPDPETRHHEQGKRGCSVHKLLDTVSANILDFPKMYPAYSEDLFFNMNTPEDYEIIRKKLFQNNF